mmetsp:Transcript_55015/g.174942  ORF Transcript_55015/g.174942 Transcript_55015/m.174942 type:complete len:751 (+) Transcript_55015:115-2367(+)
MVARALLALWARSATAWLLLARRAPQVPSPPPPGRRGAPPAPRGPQRSAWRLPARASADACPGSLHPTPLWGRRARPAPLGARAEAGRRPRLQSRGWRRSPGGGAPPASTPAHAGCVKAVVPLRGAAWRARGARCAPGARMATSAWAWTAAPVRGAVAALVSFDLDFLGPSCQREASYPSRFAWSLLLPLGLVAVDVTIFGALGLWRAARGGGGGGRGEELERPGGDVMDGFPTAEDDMGGSAELESGHLPMPLNDRKPIVTGRRKRATEVESFTYKPKLSFASVVASSTSEVLRLTYLPICYKTFLMLACTEGPSGRSILTTDASSFCWEGDHERYTPFAAVACVAYVAGAPLAAMWMLARGRRSDDLYVPWHLHRFGDVYGKFVSKYHYWEICQFARKGLLAASVAFLDSRGAEEFSRVGMRQGLAVLVVLLVGGCGHLYARPFADSRLGSCETAALAALILQVCLGMAMSDGVSGAGGAAAGAKDAFEGLWFITLAGAATAFCVELCRDLRRTHVISGRVVPAPRRRSSEGQEVEEAGGGISPESIPKGVSLEVKTKPSASFVRDRGGTTASSSGSSALPTGRAGRNPSPITPISPPAAATSMGSSLDDTHIPGDGRHHAPPSTPAGSVLWKPSGGAHNDAELPPVVPPARVTAALLQDDSHRQKKAPSFIKSIPENKTITITSGEGTSRDLLPSGEIGISRDSAGGMGRQWSEGSSEGPPAPPGSLGDSAEFKQQLAMQVVEGALN